MRDISLGSPFQCLGNPFYGEILPDVQHEPSLVQSEAVLSFAVAGCLGEEADSPFATTNNIALLTVFCRKTMGRL